MKPELQRIKAALGGPSATTPFARMVKYQEGRLWAYGGTLCLSVPTASTLECGFKPKPMEDFFELPREGATFTTKDGFLVMKHGIAEDRVEIVPAENIPSLQAVGRRIEVTEQLEHLDIVAKLCRNMTADFTQGAWFRDGLIFAMQGRSVCFSTNGLPKQEDGFQIPEFGLPADSMLALSRIKSPLAWFVRDQQCVQFEFDDGTWLASRVLDGLDTPDFMAAFNGGDDPDIFKPVVFAEGVVKEIMSRKMAEQDEAGVVSDMVWVGEGGKLDWFAKSGSGTLGEDAYTGPDFRIKGTSLRTVLALSEDVGLIFRKDCYCTMNAYGDAFAIAACLSRAP